MKNTVTNSIRAGIFILLTFLTGCIDEGDPISLGGNTSFQESAELKVLSNQLIDAFNEKSLEKISPLVFEDRAEKYMIYFESIQNNLPNIANAIKNRKLISQTENYAEYEFEVNGNTYTFTYCISSYGKWKLLRI